MKTYVLIALSAMADLVTALVLFAIGLPMIGALLTLVACVFLFYAFLLWRRTI